MKPTPDYLTDPFGALENAILSGQRARFDVCLKWCVAKSAELEDIVWPDHAIYLMTMAHLGGVKVGTLAHMLDALMNCPFPPPLDANPSPMESAIRIKSPLLAKLVEAGFSYDDRAENNIRILARQIHEGDLKQLRLVSPGLLASEDACAMVFDELFDVNADVRTHILNAASFGQALDELMGMPVHPDIARITAGAWLRKPKGGGGGFAEQLFEARPSMQDGLQQLVNRGWFTPSMVRQVAIEMRVDPERMTRMQPILAQLELTMMERITPAAPGRARTAGRL